MMTAAAGPAEPVAAPRPGGLIGLLSESIAAQDGSGWSRGDTLARELERRHGVQAPQGAVEHALRVLQRRRAVSLRLDDRGLLWYRMT